MFDKLHKIREDLENKIANRLRSIQGDKKVDKAERIIAIAVAEAISSYFGKPLPPATANKIADSVVKACDIANPIIVRQLEKD